jgi:3-oxoadipate enol-lactonase
MKTNSAFIFEGKIDAPVVVLANSLAAAPQMWDAQVAKLKKSYRVLRYSYQGHGDTPPRQEVASIESLGEDLIELLDGLQIKQFAFVGLSLGAMLGLYLAAKFPHRVTSLVAANFRPFQIEVTQGQWNDRIALVKEKGISAIVDGTADRWLTESFRKTHAAQDQNIRQMIARTSAQGFIACASAVRDYDARKFMSEIQCPVLLISGTHDMAAPVAEFACVREAVKKSSYLELNAAHISNIECESEFTDAIMSFLKANA